MVHDVIGVRLAVGLALCWLWAGLLAGFFADFVAGLFSQRRAVFFADSVDQGGHCSVHRIVLQGGLSILHGHAASKAFLVFREPFAAIFIK